MHSLLERWAITGLRTGDESTRQHENFAKHGIVGGKCMYSRRDSEDSDIYVDPIKGPLEIASAMIERRDCSEMRYLP